MQITLETRPYAALETEALVSYVFEETDPIQGRISEFDQAANGLLRNLARSGELTGKTLEMTLIHAPAGLKAKRLLLVGAGKREQFNGATLRKIAGAALRYLKARSVKQLAFLVRENNATEEFTQAIAEGALAANFESDKYKTEKKNGKSIDTVLLTGYSDADRAAAEKRTCARPRHRRSPEFCARPHQRAIQQTHSENSCGKSRSHGQASGPRSGNPRREKNHRPQNGRFAQRFTGRARTAPRNGRHVHARKFQARRASHRSHRQSRYNCQLPPAPRRNSRQRRLRGKINVAVFQAVRASSEISAMAAIRPAKFSLALAPPAWPNLSLRPADSSLGTPRGTCCHP